MKKTLLALATTGALVVSGSALAAFADAPQGEGSGASAQIEITGTIINTNPIWMWQIPAALQTAVTDVALKRVEGVSVGNNTEFALTKTPMNVLEGYMKTPTVQGGAGLTPLISIGGMDMMTECGTSAGCTISLKATNAGEDVADVVIDAIQTWSYAHENSSGTVFVGLNHDANNTAVALNILKRQANFDITYPSPTKGAAATASQVNGFLADSATKKVAQSRVSVVKSSKLVAPTGAIPTVWAATLPITVTQP